MLKAIERLYYEPVNQLTQLWFSDLRQFALRRYKLWLDYWYAFDAMPQGFERVELEALYELKRRGQKLREIRVFRCSNYRSLSL